MGFFSLSSKARAIKAALVTPTGIDAQKQEERLRHKKSPPSDAAWRVLTFKDGTEIVTRQNPSALARKFMGIRSRLDEEGIYLDRQKATVDILCEQFGGEKMREIKEYFSSVREVPDSAKFREYNRFMAAAQTQQQRNEAMRERRENLLKLTAQQVKRVPNAGEAREMAVELNALVGPSLPGSLALTSDQEVLLRDHIKAVSAANEAVGNEKWTKEKTIESILQLPTARWMDERVFDALVSYHKELATQRLQEQAMQSLL